MKKILLVFSWILFSLGVQAQNSSSHLTFKGIPIDGKRDVFVEKLKQKGYKYIGLEQGLACFYGDFASFKNCYIAVSTLDHRDLVNSVMVVLPKSSTWKTLYGNYIELKSMLITKYGPPTKEKESFDGYQPKTDSDKLFKVKTDQCNFTCIFENSKGKIQLSISKTETIDCIVGLMYYDKINCDLEKADAIDDL